MGLKGFPSGIEIVFKLFVEAVQLIRLKLYIVFQPCYFFVFVIDFHSFVLAILCQFSLNVARILQQLHLHHFDLSDHFLIFDVVLLDEFELLVLVGVKLFLLVAELGFLLMDFLLQILDFVLEVFCLFVFFFLDKFTLLMG